MRNRLVVANWKMNGSLEANARWAEAFLALEDAGCDAAVCAPSVYLSQMACLLKGSSVALGAQDVNEFESGAYTGEVSARMLAEIGCSYVIVGHSERRALYGDTDDRVALKAKPVFIPSFAWVKRSKNAKQAKPLPWCRVSSKR